MTTEELIALVSNMKKGLVQRKYEDSYNNIKYRIGRVVDDKILITESGEVKGFVKITWYNCGKLNPTIIYPITKIDEVCVIYDNSLPIEENSFILIVDHPKWDGQAAQVKAINEDKIYVKLLSNNKEIIIPKHKIVLIQTELEEAVKLNTFF